MANDWICTDCEYMKVYPQTMWEPAEYECKNKKCDFYATDGAFDEDGNELTECDGFKMAEWGDW